MARPDGTTGKTITTGSTEIDKKLGGGIPVGSLVLLEGQSDAGKSVLTQHFSHSTLSSKISVACYTTENTVKSLMSQMNSLNLDVTDYFLCDRLRIYPVEMSAQEQDTSAAFAALQRHFESLPSRFELIIFDSLTGMVAHAEDRGLIDFFAACKKICDQGRTIVTIVHTGSESVFSFNDMDVILQYTDVSDNTTITYLRFDSVAAGVNEWTVPATGVQPDSFNPKVWDSDETLTIDIQVSPLIKSGTDAHVVVGTPQGVADQSNLTNP